MIGLATGCRGDLRDPLGVVEPDHPTGHGGGPSPVVGTWEVTLVIDAGGDLQTWTTRWQFGGDGSCRFTQTVKSIVEGIPRTETRECRFVDRGSSVEVTYTDDQSMASLPYSIPIGSADQLVLEGVLYDRVA